MKQKVRPNFWKKFPLSELNPSEWEMLCDGCGKCCLIKLENKDTTKIHYTNIACQLFDDKNCKCSNYQNRKKVVNNCLVLTHKSLKNAYRWMPNTCAYRLLYENKELKPWHHLISGSKESVHNAKMSVRNSTLSENDIPEKMWQDYITNDYSSLT